MLVWRKFVHEITFLRTLIPLSGLFTPNAGQHFRDEQRRRRSQYDRGTRLAALEEYDYDAAVHHLCGTT